MWPTASPPKAILCGLLVHRDDPGTTAAYRLPPNIRPVTGGTTMCAKRRRREGRDVAPTITRGQHRGLDPERLPARPAPWAGCWTTPSTRQVTPGPPAQRRGLLQAEIRTTEAFMRR